jgi:hypothetical protein
MEGNSLWCSKLKDIDSVVVSFKEENVGKLILNLKEILYCTPDKTIQVGEDGNLLIVCEPVQ